MCLCVYWSIFYEVLNRRQLFLRMTLLTFSSPSWIWVARQSRYMCLSSLNLQNVTLQLLFCVFQDKNNFLSNLLSPHLTPFDFLPPPPSLSFLLTCLYFCHFPRDAFILYWHCFEEHTAEAVNKDMPYRFLQGQLQMKDRKIDVCMAYGWLRFGMRLRSVAGLYDGSRERARPTENIICSPAITLYFK